MPVKAHQEWSVLLLALIWVLGLCAPAVFAMEEREGNDTFDQATDYIVGEVIYGLISVESDQDFYRFYAVEDAEVKVFLSEIPLTADFDLAVYDERHMFLALSSRGNNTPEEVSFVAPSSGYYYIQISSWCGISTTPYIVQISVQGDGDDTPERAQAIIIPDDNASVSVQNMIYSATDVDWYTGFIEIPQKIRVQMRVPALNDFDIYVYDKNFREIGRGVMDIGTAEEIDIYITPSTKGQIYFQIINSEQSANFTEPYILTVQTIPDKPIKAVREAYRYVTCDMLWQGRFPYDSPPGVAYSWGGKDTLEYFLQKLQDNEQTGVKSASWVDQFTFTGGRYNNKPDAPNIEEVKRWGVGLKGETIWAGGPDYNNPFRWAGIDCSGLVQRCQYAAGYAVPNIGGGKFNALGGEVPAGWWADHCDKIGDSKTGIANVQIGDVVTVKNAKGRITHVMLVSYVPYGVTPNKDNVKVIHAFSSPYLSGRKVQETLLNRVSNYTIWRNRDWKEESK